MVTRIGINGFGRIGRLVLRANEGRNAGKVEVAAVNDLTDAETNAHLLKYDTNYGRYPGKVEANNGDLVVDGRSIKVFSERDPAQIPWGEMGVDLVIESTGISEPMPVAATFSCEPVGKWLSFWLEKLGVRPNIRFAPYGTLQHELVKPTAAVRRADAFVALLCLSDWQRGGAFDSAKFDDDLALFVSSLRGAVEQLPFVALVLCPARPSAQQTKFSAATMTLQRW